MNRILSFLRLLAIPLMVLGLVQYVFGILSVLVFKDQVAAGFFEPAIAGTLLSSAIYLASSRSEHKLSYREALLFVSLTWMSCSVMASIPMIVILEISITDALFESVSALTTTGATVLSGLDEMPRTFLMYRQFLQWLGGMGVVVFVVAILPKLNIGGMKIFLAEAPGPTKDEKLAPRITHTARYLWYIYAFLTLLCAIGYVVAGMPVFDAIAHAFTTVATGGFSTHDASLGHFDSRWVEINAIVFMLLGGLSFALHFRFTRERRLSLYWKDEECRTFLFMVLGLGLLLLWILGRDEFYPSGELLYQSFFHLVSFITSTGYGTGDYPSWPAGATLLLLFAGYIGGCGGSTSGGNKMIRNIISVKVIGRQLRQLIHQRGSFVVRYNGKPVQPDVSSATLSYLGAAAILSMVLSLIMMMTGLDFWTAFTAVAACLNVLGPAFGEVGANYQPVSDAGTWILSFTMLLGRLEFFTLLVLFSPAYWRY